MIGTAFLLMLAAPTEPPSVPAKPAATESKSCRDMILSSSRLGVTKVCKTRAGWRRYDACHSSVTRYCSPKKKKAIGTLASANANGAATPHDGLRIVCKSVKATGTRLSTERVCMPKREWQRLSDETDMATKNEVTSFSKRPNRGCTLAGCF